MQSIHGNSAVAPAIPGIGIEERNDAGVAPTASLLSRLEGPSGSVSVSGGAAEINAPEINLKAPSVKINGELVSDQIKTDNVMSENVNSSGVMRADNMLVTGHLTTGSLDADSAVTTEGQLLTGDDINAVGNISLTGNISAGGEVRGSNLRPHQENED